MIIKQLELTNIRSHESTKIEFAEGKTLLRGNIGSGKSSIIMAIEAALFGKDKIKELITFHKESGTIKLTFESKDERNFTKKYTVTRNLTKKGQKPGVIEYHDEKKYLDLSARELDEAIIEILNIKQTKTAQEVFRYFVLAKQGELKELVKGDGKADLKNRTETLHTAFEMESYNFAIDYAETLGQEIRRAIQFKKGEIKRLNEINDKIKEKNDKIIKIKKDLETITQSLKVKKENYISKKDEFEKIENERKKINEINASIKFKEREINEKKEEVINNDKRKNIKKDKLAESGKTSEQIIKEIEESLPLEKLRENEDKLTEQISHLETDMKLKEKDAKSYEEIREVGKCGTCGREINESSGYDELISTANMEKKDIEIEIIKRNKEKSIIRETIVENQKNADLKRDVEEINTINETNKVLDKKIKNLIEEINEQNTKLNELPDVNKLNLLKDKKDSAEKEFRDEEKKSTEKNQVLRNENENLNNLNLELEKLEQTKLEIIKLNDINEWLSEYFINTVEEIRKSVSNIINQRFNELFVKWFKTLVNDQIKNVRVDEQFTPIIEHRGEWQTYDSLSGGEQAAVALAYRAALNKLIRQRASGFRPELLMLDEPTDGFSDEQVTKIIDMLVEEVDNKQVIIVSHSDLFTSLDQVIEIKKENGISRIYTHSYGD